MLHVCHDIITARSASTGHFDLKFLDTHHKPTNSLRQYSDNKIFEIQISVK